MQIKGQIRLSRGAVAEVEFQRLCSKLNLECCKPFVEGMPYDFVVRGLSKSKRFSTVQVKSSYPKDNRQVLNITKSGPKGSRKPYQKGDFEYLAAYRSDTNEWYIIPYAIISKIKDSITISSNKWNRFKVRLKND